MASELEWSDSDFEDEYATKPRKICSTGQGNPRVIKVLLVGNTGAGKTALLNRYCDDTFRTDFLMTIGIDFKIKTSSVADTLVKTQIWDTAGSHRFRTITTAYYRGAHAVGLCFDETAEHDSEMNQLREYLQTIKRHTPEHCRTLLVGCHADHKDRPRTITDADIKILMAEAHDPAKQYAQPYDFIRTSARDNTNVTEVFDSMQRAALESKHSAAATTKNTPRKNPKKKEPQDLQRRKQTVRIANWSMLAKSELKEEGGSDDTKQAEHGKDVPFRPQVSFSAHSEDQIYLEPNLITELPTLHSTCLAALLDAFNGTRVVADTVLGYMVKDRLKDDAWTALAMDIEAKDDGSTAALESMIRTATGAFRLALMRGSKFSLLDEVELQFRVRQVSPTVRRLMLVFPGQLPTIPNQYDRVNVKLSSDALGEMKRILMDPTLNSIDQIDFEKLTRLFIESEVVSDITERTQWMEDLSEVTDTSTIPGLKDFMRGIATTDIDPSVLLKIAPSMVQSLYQSIKQEDTLNIISSVGRSIFRLPLPSDSEVRKGYNGGSAPGDDSMHPLLLGSVPPVLTLLGLCVKNISAIHGFDSFGRLYTCGIEGVDVKVLASECTALANAFMNFEREQHRGIAMQLACETRDKYEKKKKEYRQIMVKFNAETQKMEEDSKEEKKKEKKVKRYRARPSKPQKPKILRVFL